MDGLLCMETGSADSETHLFSRADLSAGTQVLWTRGARGAREVCGLLGIVRSNSRREERRPPGRKETWLKYIVIGLDIVKLYSTVLLAIIGK